MAMRARAHALIAGATAASIALPAPMSAARRPRNTSASTRRADVPARRPRRRQLRMVRSARRRARQAAVLVLGHSA